MKTEIIGRDPIIMMQIVRMIGDRNRKAQRRSNFIRRVKQAICIWR